jgi:phosphoesterase RecJ-like protein
MNYKKSKDILRKVSKAKRILVNCHRGPDPDSVGSALAMSYVLKKMKKDVNILCPSEKIYDELSFLRDYTSIKKKVDFRQVDFSDYDLFLVLDSSDWSMVTPDIKILKAEIDIVVIDHHHTNTLFGALNLVDERRSSTSELVYMLFEDWRVKIGKDVATALLTGIMGDTGVFKYPNTSYQTFSISCKLMQAGAQKNLIIENLYRSYDFRLIKFWAEALERAEEDKENRFVYSMIPFEIFEKWGRPENAKELTADLFTQSIEKTDFGFVALEKQKNKVSVSLRARGDFDTSLIAEELGGGGHKAASGATVEGLPFDLAAEKILKVARKFAKKSPEKNIKGDDFSKGTDT